MVRKTQHNPELTRGRGVSNEPPCGFAPWYESHWGRLVGALTLTLADRSAAEDVAAEAFRKAFERWDTLIVRGDPSPWLYTVAWNDARSRHRRLVNERLALRRLHARSTVVLPGPATPAPEVWAAVRALPPRMRQAVALRYVADLTESDTADVLGVSRGTIASTLSEARRRLATMLPAPDEDPTGEAEEDQCRIS